MQALEELYNKEYFGKRMDWKPPVYKIIAEGINEIYDNPWVVDVGCGNGVLLEHLTGVGVEGAYAAILECAKKGLPVCWHDLRDCNVVESTDHLSVSIEVAEHIEPDYVGPFLDNLTDNAHIVILTASNEPSPYHFNPQPKEYWIKKMKDRGFELKDRGLYDYLKDRIPKERDYLYKNLMTFEKETRTGQQDLQR